MLHGPANLSAELNTCRKCESEPLDCLWWPVVVGKWLGLDAYCKSQYTIRREVLTDGKSTNYQSAHGPFG
jgi:hypothetical protein